MKIPPVYAFQLTKNCLISSYLSLGDQGWRCQGRTRAEAWGEGGLVQEWRRAQEVAAPDAPP